MKDVITVNAIRCNKCGDTIYSRSRHDFRWCSCGSCAIDGGQKDYIKVTGMDFSYTTLDLENVSLSDLYNDWSKSINKYGLIQNKSK